MKILFSNPPWWENDTTDEHKGALRIGIRAGSRWPFTRFSIHEPDKFSFGAYLPAPFFLEYAASYTKRLIPEAEVHLVDSIARGDSQEKFAAQIAAGRYDWIVIETATPSWGIDEQWIGTIAKLSPTTQIILCGTLDCARAPEVLSAHPNVAAIVQGEPDKQIAKVITGARGLIPHDLLTVAEMNAAPLPAFDTVAATHYWDACPAGQKAPQLQIWTSRGCPFKCVFCVWPAVMTGNDPDGTKPRSLRRYSADYVERLIRKRMAWATAQGTPFKSIYLDDDTFNLSEPHTLAMCDVMARIGLPWSAMCRADTISRTAWQAMKDAGCFGVKIGFESGSQWVIDHIVNKRLNIAEAADTARWLRTIGITVHGTFTVGLPGETPEQRKETVDFITNLYATGGLDTHQLSGTSEIEGTPLHTLRTAGHLAKYDGAKLDANYEASADGQKKIEGMRK